MRTILVLPLLISNLCFAEVYKYIDEDGQKHYVTDLKKVPEKYQGQVTVNPTLPKITKSTAVDWEKKKSEVSETAEGEEATETIKSKPVAVYVTPNCPYCDKLEAQLKKKKVAFSRHDLTKDFEAQKKFTEMGGDATPLITIGEQVIKGYQPEKINKALGLNK